MFPFVVEELKASLIRAAGLALRGQVYPVDAGRYRWRGSETTPDRKTVFIAVNGRGFKSDPQDPKVVGLDAPRGQSLQASLRPIRPYGQCRRLYDLARSLRSQQVR